MKVLFVSSGNSGDISPIVLNQARSLLSADDTLEIDFFLVKGKGLKGYLRHIPALRKQVRAFRPDLIHAHYSLCGMLAALAFTKVPVITSLMGSDVKSSGTMRRIINFCSRRAWKASIVKSGDLDSSLQLRNKHVIPNGVDLSVFRPTDKTTGVPPVILFAADPSRKEKNFSLAEAALEKIEAPFELRTLVQVPHAEMPAAYSRADIVLLTSLWEGSPNVIKEAMACGLPVVCTDVGDVRTLFGNGKGLYLSSFDPTTLAGKLREAMQYASAAQMSEGRERIMALNIDSESIARRIVALYKSCTGK